MSAYLMSSRRILGSDLITTSVTNQAGARALVAVPAAANYGDMTFSPSGTPTTGINERIEIVGEGDLKTATFKSSADGGSTYKGRRADTEWEDGAGGTTPKNIILDSATITLSRPVAIDRDGDGVLDRVLIAVLRTSTTPDQIDVYYTDTLDGTGSWSSLATNVFSSAAVSSAVSLLWHGNAVFCFSFVTSVGWQVVKSTDYGVTWGAAVTIDATGPGSYSGCDSISLACGKILFVYMKDNGGLDHVYCSASNAGGAWSTGKQVTAGSIDYQSPSVIQEADGKTVCFFQRVTASAAIQARQSTSTNPGSSAASWEDYSETLWSADTTDVSPSACIAPDGTIYVMICDTSPLDFLHFSKFKDGDANYSVVATAYSELTNQIVTPRLANIGGAIWCAFVDADDFDAHLLVTRYWGTYDTTNYPASWTGTSAQFLHDGAWITPGGANASNGDTYDIDSEFDYGADRMVMLTPSRPTRATGDAADWSAPFNTTASRVVPVDTICVWANVKDCKFQGDTSSTFTPDKTTTVSFIESTIASASVTWSAGVVTRSSGTWTAGALVGKRIRAATSALVAVIADNSTTAIYADTDMSTWTGDLQILSPRAWATQTAAAYQYVRLLIDSQQTAEDYYEVKALAAGMRYELPSNAIVHRDYEVARTDTELRSGTIIRSIDGTVRRRFTVPLIGITTAQRDAVLSLLTNQGGRPLVLIPDSSNAYDWALVQPVTPFAPNARRTEIQFVEVI